MATEEKSYSSLDTEEIFKSYGILMRDAVSLNCDGLIKCFDDILLSFDTYDLHLEQNSIAWKNYSNILIPSILEKEADLETFYEKIDGYQLLIKCLKKSFDELEKKMETAEREFSSVNKFKKFFNTKLLSNKSTIAEDRKTNRNEFDDIFSHDDAFVKNEEINATKEF